MYAYIKGIVVTTEKNYIIIDNNGIGYMIFVSNPYNYHENQECLVYIYTHIKEDAHLLYGFKTIEERDMFIKLISVKGVGPTMGISLLASGVKNIMDAIERENIIYLKKFPKVGDKVAKQIIFELKGKLPVIAFINNSNSYNELIDVLEGLGYKKSDINKILPNIKVDDKIEDQVKEALKLFLK